MAWKILEEQAPFEAALKAYRRRVPMTDEDFQELLDQNHEVAFKIADINSLELVFDVWQALDRSLENGTDFRTFKKEFGARLKEQWSGTSKQKATRLATVFRNQTQQSYNHGRYLQMEEPELKRLRPYRLFDAVRDKRTSKICKDCNGTLLPADDPWWDSHVPPLHHACRSTVRSLRARDAARRGVTQSPTETASAEGFGSKPQRQVTPIEVDLSKYPPELRAAFERKQAA